MRAQDDRVWFAGAGLTLVLVLGLGVSAVRFAPHGSVLAAWWPAAGVAVAFLAASPPRRRPGFLVGLAVVVSGAALLAGRPPLVAVALGVTNAAGAAVVIAVLGRRSPGRIRLRTMEDLWLLVLATVLGSLVVGTLVALTLSVGFGSAFWAIAATVTASHSASVLLIAPLGMDVSGPCAPSGRAERLVQVVLTLSVLVAVFSPGQVLPLDFLPIPLLMWGAARLPLRLVTLELLAVGIVASLMTSLGNGPLATDLVRDGMRPETISAIMQAYLVCIALAVLALGLAGGQRLEALSQALAGEERLRRSFSESLVGMVLLRDAPTGLVVEEVNQVAAAQLGGEVEQLLGRPWGSGLSRADRNAMAAACADVVAGASTGWVCEVRLGHGPEGETGSGLASEADDAPEHWARVAVSALDRPGEERRLSVQLVDLTAERKAQQDLVRERDFTGAVLDSTHTLIVVLDSAGRVVRFNPAAAELSGYPADEVVGRPVWDVVGPRLGDRLRVRLAEGAGWSGPHLLEEEWLTRSGDRRLVAWSCAALDTDAARPHLVMTGIDVTDERLAQRRVEQVLAATTGTSIIGTDRGGVITFFNPGAERLLGYRAEEVVGKATPAIFHDPDEMAARGEELGLDSTVALLVAGVGSGTRTEKRDWKYVRKDGRRITMSLTVSPMTSASGGLVGYLGVAEDVTERRRVEDMLRVALTKEREAVERLNDVDRAKNDFVSTVSHELRTPITSVLGYTQMLQRGSGGGLTARQAKLLGRVESNGLRLQALIEDLLTLSRIEAGTFTLRLDPVDLRDVVARATEATETLRHGRSTQWVVETGDQPVLVTGDEDQLDRALINLVSNALKFTPDEGRVRVALGTTDESAVLVVEDTGIGIPEDEQAQLFERFFRSSAAQKRAIPGTGLGLSIVQSIVHGHGGAVAATSRAGSGSRFEVHLPLLVSAGAAPAGPRPGVSARRG